MDELGLVDENGEVHIEANNPILNIFPIRVCDDGMGYGIGDQYFTSASSSFPNNLIALVIFSFPPISKLP